MIRKLITDACGPEFARRLFLKDGDGNFWDEKNHRWTKNFAEAALFSNPDNIGERMHELMVAQPGELHQFTAPVVIDVKSEEPVDVAALQQWLDKAVQMFMNARHGVGPGESMVMLCIDWAQLKEEVEDEL